MHREDVLRSLTQCAKEALIRASASTPFEMNVTLPRVAEVHRLVHRPVPCRRSKRMTRTLIDWECAW